MIHVSLNNESVTVEDGVTLQQALQQWDYAGKKCAVAINGEFVPRTQYDEVMLSDADEIDIVAPVGGG